MNTPGKALIARTAKMAILALLFTATFTEIYAQARKDVLPKAKRQFFIDPAGNDTNPGTADKPWKTLDKANRELQPGDMAIFCDGIYEGIINPANSGRNATEQIVYSTENRHGAVLIGQEGSRYIINLSGKNFIAINGFKMLPASGGFGMIRECNHITLQNCHMEKSSMVYCPLEFIDGDYHRMLYNNMTRVIQRTADSKIHGDGCHFIDSSYNLIEGNSFSEIGHSPLRIWPKTPNQSNFNVIRGNVFHNGWGRNFEFFNLNRSLFEDNIITKAFNGSMSADALGKVFFIDGIFRHNVIHDNWDNPLASTSYIDGPTTGDVHLELNNSRIYNNTFANNPTYLWSFGGSEEAKPIRTNIFLNNLFARNDYLGDYTTFMMVRPGINDDNLILNNLFFGEKPNQAVIRFRDKDCTAMELNQMLSKTCQANLDADPLFEDMRNYFFLLKEGSPAIDAGAHLAITLKSGSGKILPVTDARYFFDGFGIDGEQGDLIRVGSNKTLARVVKADIQKNELTIDRNLKWQEGDPVNLPYGGKGPDIGAIERNNSSAFNVTAYASPAVAKINSPVSFAAIVNGAKGSVKMEWDLGDGTFTSGNAPQYKYKECGDYIVRLRATDASGSVLNKILLVRVEKGHDPGQPLLATDFEEENFEIWGHLWDRGPVRGRNSYYPEMRDDGKGQAMCVSTEAVNTTLATNVKVWYWDIDDYPNIRFSYRIPKDVPVGLWVEPWASRNRPERICLGGTSTNSSGKFPDLKALNLVDDGQWHIAEIDVRKVRQIVPGIKSLKVVGFSTLAKTETGQKFWFDDFSIAP